MSNWDLMMPGMGLTAIGLAGVTISYAGIAHTFVDGMHALTGLTMFVGLIFLSVGILDGGISTSNRAKATTLVIISIALGFGTFGLTSATGIIMWFAFGLVSPDTYMINEPIVEVPEIVQPTGPIFAITILENSAIQGNPDYEPDVAHFPKGHIIEWTNADTVA